MDSKFKEILEEVLKKDHRLWNNEKTEFNIPLLFNLIDKMDERIIGLLLDREETRKKFFLKVKDAYIFKSKEFKFFIEEHKVFNSYTSYPNRIGLYDGKEFIMDRTEVVINFPFKDCILEGGQTTEEGIDTYFEYDEKVTKTQEKQGWEAETYNKKQDKRKEIFFNEILAQDEIDRLLDEKAFVNWKRYTKNGVEEVEEIKRDKNGLIRENLIIKGNNLLALESLKSQFKGQIKLIYIDPPYYFMDNKDQDSFRYNTNFKLSTWLTFMKNRLEIAKELLKDDGVIFVQIDDDGQAYLKVLMDEIFGQKNYLNTICVKMKNIAGASGGGEDKKLKKNIEFILLYCKDYEFVKSYNPVYEYTEIYDLVQYYRENNISWKYTSVLYYEGDKEYLCSTVDGSGDEIKIYKRINPIFKSVSQIAKEEGLSEREVYYKYMDRIFTTAMPQSSIRERVLEVIEREEDRLELYSIEYIPKSGKNKGKIYEQFYKGKKLRLVTWLRDVVEKKGDLYYKKDLKGTFWDGINLNNLSKEGNVRFPNGKKPEQLIKDIMKLYVEKGDIVLDFFLGSGTTAAVAHKMNIQYIGIEQLDYGKEDAVTRLKNVINGDENGISKDEDINWQGGGNFIYCELAKWNEKAKEEIMNCNSLEELKELFTSLCDKYYLDYNIRVNEFKNKIIEEEEFKKLPLEEQKKMFLTMLDLNQLYVQRTEMEDKKYGISEKDQRLTRMFYGEE